MEPALKLEIAKHSRKYITSKTLSQVDFANKSGVPKEYITNILKGNFEINAGADKVVVIADKYFQKLADFIGYETEASYWENRATPQFISIIANLQDAKKYRSTSLIIGETGSGKSHGINLFLRKYPTDTFVVTIGSTDNLTDIIDKIIDVLKITTGKSKSKKLGDIAKKLKSLKEAGLEPQLIFDESEYMKQPALCSVKELHDYLNKYCSLVLIGTQQLLSNIDILRKRNKPGIPQFYRRIKFGIRLLPAVDKSFKLFLNDIESIEVKKFLRRICENYGELHDVLVPVKREAERTGETITEDFIRKVLNLPISLYAKRS